MFGNNPNQGGGGGGLFGGGGGAATGNTGGGLFGGGGGNRHTGGTASLFANPPQASIFGGAVATGGFTAGPTGLGGATTAGSLFGGNAPAGATTAGSLFGGNAPAGTTTAGSLFGGSSSGSLFGGSTAGGLFGGGTKGAVTAKTDEFQPTWMKYQGPDNNTWTYYASVVVNNIAIVLGTMTDTNNNLTQSIMAFDFKKSDWLTVKTVGDQFNFKQGLSACLYKDNKIVVFGGRELFSPVKDVFMITITADRMSVTADVRLVNTSFGNQIYLYGHTANVYKDTMYVFGGLNQNGTGTSEVYGYDLVNNTWNPVGYNGPTTRFEHSSAIIENKLYIYGGYSVNNELLSDFCVYDINTASWQTLNPKGTSPGPKKGITMVAIDDKLYFFGGCNVQYTSDVFVYDIKKNTWEQVQTKGKEPSPRGNHLAVTFKKDLIVLGGRDSNTYFSDVCRLHLTPDSLSALTIVEGEEARGSDANYVMQMRTLFNDKSYHDITFKVDGKEVTAHKCILFARCKFFQNMFTSQMQESRASSIDVGDVNIKTFQALLEFIYCNKIILTEDLALDLLELSDKYSFNELKDLCGQFLSEHLTAENYIVTSEIAERLDISSLKEATVKFIIRNLENIGQRDDSGSLSKTMLWEAIFKMNDK